MLNMEMKLGPEDVVDLLALDQMGASFKIYSLPGDTDLGGCLTRLYFKCVYSSSKKCN